MRKIHLGTLFQSDDEVRVRVAAAVLRFPILGSFIWYGGKFTSQKRYYGTRVNYKISNKYM